ncbi:MAG: hypothetical protein GXY84_04760 [Clostridiales bacterium]|nr:hypothetical protein [Clostridiales bacterium]
MDAARGKVNIEVTADTCERCGVPIIKTSNRQKYCLACGKEERRRKHAARMRKSRS